MSLALDSQRSTSPANSERSSPAPRLTRRRLEDISLRQDKNYRRYASGIERALSLFETAVEEWADYIAFLGRLLKAIQAYPPNGAPLPHSAVVAKRLAQCLNPSLPSGVHQKTLEVYDYIFSAIGKDALARDLSLYLPGLSPVLSFASLPVRPQYLALFEKYIINLDTTTLRPAFKAIILCLLPGLEEETSDEFERTMRILECFRDGARAAEDNADVDPSNQGSGFFWQCFFLASITSSSRRQGALAFLARNLPELTSAAFQLRENEQVSHKHNVAISSVISPEPGLLLRCFVAGLSDSQLLIQRGFLDLLVTHLPLDSPVLQKEVKPNDLDRLVSAAVSVTERRDMSLNRRLWVWLLGPDNESGQDQDNGRNPSVEVSSSSSTPNKLRSVYICNYGLRPLERSILRMFKSETIVPRQKARPFRICLSLIDKWAIGYYVIPHVFVPAVESLLEYHRLVSKQQFDEVLKSASMFYNALESHVIWSQIFDLVNSATSSGVRDRTARLKDLKLVKFIVTAFSIQEEEMLTVHVPILTLAMMTILEDYKIKDLPDNKTYAEDTEGIPEYMFNLVELLAQSIPDRAFTTMNGQSQDVLSMLDSSLSLRKDQILHDVQEFYANAAKDPATARFRLPPRVVGELLLTKAANSLSHALQDRTRHSSIVVNTHLVTSLVRKVHNSVALHQVDLLSAFHQILSPSFGQNVDEIHISFLRLSPIVATLACLNAARSEEPYLLRSHVAELVPALVKGLWPYLSPAYPKFHVEAVRLIGQLHAITIKERLVEASICAIISGLRNSDNGDNSTMQCICGGFAVLWTHATQAVINKASVGPKGDASNRMDRTSNVLLRERNNDNADLRDSLVRPLLSFLDPLSGANSDLRFYVKSWFNTLPNVHEIFSIIASLISQVDFPRSIDPDSRDANEESHQDNLQQCVYLLRTLSHVLVDPSEHVWLAFANSRAVGFDARGVSAPENGFAEESPSLQRFFAQRCLSIITSMGLHNEPCGYLPPLESWRLAIQNLHQILAAPYSNLLASMELLSPLLETLRKTLNFISPSIQASLLEVTSLALKLKTPDFDHTAANDAGGNKTSEENAKPLSRLSLTSDRTELPIGSTALYQQQLLRCLLDGFASKSIHPVLDNWNLFLSETLALFGDSIFQNLIPLVDCFCAQITKVFEDLKETFSASEGMRAVAPESTLIKLLDGLEQILAEAHDCLVMNERKVVSAKSPEQPQGFFGNMVSGVFSSESQRNLGSMVNARLAVVLAFQDAVRVCFSIWSWNGYGDDTSPERASIASFSYTSLRMRTRTRRLLEHLFAAEAQECLETLAVRWCRNRVHREAAAILNLLHMLDSSRPKNTIPAIFNAIHSRISSSAMDPMRKSTLSSDIADRDLVTFLIEYTQSLEDDAMDEIWTDCMSFLRDILANPLPHRQILPGLLYFASVLAEKVDNTNFGEQRRTRRELGDVFLRLLSATSTTTPVTSIPASHESPNAEKRRPLDKLPKYTDVTSVLASVVPRLRIVLLENDRVATAATSISTWAIEPLLRAKSFPENITDDTLDLLFELTRIPQASKTWKKDILDAFYDPRFFSSSLDQVEGKWLLVLRQWIQGDRDRLQDVLSRISPPAAAGIMFGVGANSARLEADRRTQLNLRRITLLILAADTDHFAAAIETLEGKLVELLGATPTSSPSSATRAEICMVLRAMVLNISPVHLSRLWPIIDAELQAAISSVLPDNDNHDTYNASSVLQACRLLDLLLAVAPEDFQMHEWVYITDTIDAVYKAPDWRPTALVDELAEVLGPPQVADAVAEQEQTPTQKRKAMLKVEGSVTTLSKEALVENILRPFFSQLSILSFEATYEMGVPDLRERKKDLLGDLFDEGTIATSGT